MLRPEKVDYDLAILHNKIISNKNYELLLYEDNLYRFYYNRITNHSKVYRCLRSTCPGQIVVLANGDKVLRKSCLGHFPVNNSSNRMLIVEAKSLYNHGISADDAIGSIEQTASRTGDVLPERRLIAQRLYRTLRSPSSVDMFPPLIPPDTFTLNGHDVIIYNNSQTAQSLNDIKIVIGFDGYEENLRSASVLFVDGTFHSAPTHFSQIFVIGSLTNGQFVPQIHGLMMNKRKSSYKEILEFVKFLMNGNDPEVVMSDFELAILSSVEEVFPSTRRICCFFHLLQCLTRACEREGLMNLIASDQIARKVPRRLASLSFVPCNEVRMYFRMITLETPLRMQRLTNYFFTNFIGETTSSGSIAARFPIELWNHREEVLNCGEKTNNVVETYNSRLNRYIVTRKPALSRFIKRVVKLEEKRRAALSRLAFLNITNLPHVPRNRRNAGSSHLRLAVQNGPQSSTPTEYLDKLSNHIKFFH